MSERDRRPAADAAPGIGPADRHHRPTPTGGHPIADRGRPTPSSARTRLTRHRLRAAGGHATTIGGPEYSDGDPPTTGRPVGGPTCSPACCWSWPASPPAVSLLLRWVHGDDTTGLDLVQRRLRRPPAAPGQLDGLWQPLAIVLGGGVLFVLGLLLFLPAPHAPLPRRAGPAGQPRGGRGRAGAAGRTRLADRSASTSASGSPSPSPCSGCSAALKALLTGPRYGTRPPRGLRPAFSPRRAAPCARANCDRLDQVEPHAGEVEAAPVDPVDRRAPQVGAAQLASPCSRARSRSAPVRSHSRRSASVRSASRNRWPERSSPERSAPRSDGRSSSRSRSRSSAAARAPGNCEPVSLQPSQTTSNSLARSNRQDRNAEPKCRGAGHPHAGEHAARRRRSAG